MGRLRIGLITLLSINNPTPATKKGEISKARKSPRDVAFYSVMTGDFFSLGDTGDTRKMKGLFKRIGGAGRMLGALNKVYPPEDLALTSYVYPEAVTGELCRVTEEAVGLGGSGSGR